MQGGFLEQKMYVVEHWAECQNFQPYPMDGDADDSVEYQQVFQAVKYPKALEAFYECVPCLHG